MNTIAVPPPAAGQTHPSADVFTPYLYGTLLFAVWVLVLWLVKRILLRRLAKAAEKTVNVWDDVLVRAVSVPVNLLIFASGISILVYSLPLPEKLNRFADILFQGSIIFSIVIFLERFLVGMMKKKSTAFFGTASQGLTQGIVRGLIVGIGALTFLNLIGISVTPILASLGIGSLAVALALQDTLSNFFAGIYAAVDKPFKVGDFIRLESGEEGTLIDIGWRSSRILLTSNNVVILPNTKLMGSVITNYSLPQKEMITVLTFGVDASSDLKKVEQVTQEAAHQVANSVSGVIKEFEPVVRFSRFSESGIEVNCVLRAREYSDTYLIKHELIKALQGCYQAEGIRIAFPVRTIRVEGTDAVLRGDTQEGLPHQA